MANHESSTTAKSSAMCQQRFDPCHKRFSWLPAGLERDSDAQYAAKVVDLTRGSFVIATILRQHLIDQSSIMRGDSVSPLLNETHAQDLAALLEVSLDTLRDMADTKLFNLTMATPKGSQA